MGRPKKYFTEEERIAARRASNKRWKDEHRDDENYKAKCRASCKRWRDKNPDYADEWMTEYRSTTYGRANRLLHSYKQKDKKRNQGECTLTVDWIVENVFSGQCCHYCGESDWKKLGVDRKDSSLPHTAENCVPCCKHCNDMKGDMSYDDYIEKIKSGGSPTS